MIKKMHNHLLKAAILLTALLMFLASCSSDKPGVSSDNTSARYKHIELDEAKEMISSGCILVDTRGEPQYDYERIPGSICVPVDSDDSYITESLPDKDASILLYCDYGGLSKEMAEHMSSDLGYTNISEFDGLLVWDGELEGDKYN